MAIIPEILYVTNIFNGLAITFNENVLSSEDRSFFELRGFPSSISISDVSVSSGQLIITLVSSIDVDVPVSAGIVVKDLALVLDSDSNFEFFIPFKQALKICPENGCTEEPPDWYTDYKYDYPVAVQDVRCDGGKIIISLNVPLNPTTIPSNTAFTIDGVEVDTVEVIENLIILETPLREGTLLYEPPSDTFLRTAETPFRLIAPFSRMVDCDAEDCDELRPHSNSIGIPSDVRNGRSATLDDYIEAFTLQEAVQVTNLGNAGATEVNTDRMNFALSQAHDILDGYIQIATWSGRALLIGTRVRAELVIARYMLHSDRRPADVTSDYQNLVQWIDQAHKSNSSLPSECELEDPFGGRVITGGIAQQYDPENALGLRGWALDEDDIVYRRMNGSYYPDWMKKFSRDAYID